MKRDKNNNALKKIKDLFRRKRYVAVIAAAAVGLILIFGVSRGIKVMAVKNEYSHTVQTAQKEAEKLYNGKKQLGFKESYEDVEINYIYPEQKDKEVENMIKNQMKERAYATIDDMVKKKEADSDKKMILIYKGSDVTDRIISFTVDQKIYTDDNYDFKLYKEMKEPQNIIDGKTGNKFKVTDLFKAGVDPMPTIEERAKEEMIKSGKFNLDNIVDIAKFTYPTEVVGSGIQITEKGLKVPVGGEAHGISSVDIPLNRLLSVINPDFLDEKSKSLILDNDPENLKEAKVKRVALTFDDGPNPETTGRLLDIMKKYNAKGTFYVLGEKIDRYPDTIKRIVSEGHELGNHSWNHANLLNSTKDEIYAQVLKTNYEIFRISGDFPESMRPPYGAVDAEAAEYIDMPIAMWSVDSEDWMNKGNPEKTYNNTISNTSPGAVILFHDLYDSSIDAVEKTMEKLKSEGYEFVTMSELFDYQLKPKLAYHNTKNVRDLAEEEKK